VASGRLGGRISTLIVLAASLFASLHALRVYESLLSDDAYIAFRYARNLVHHGSLSWNLGEPPIEGFTSLGYVLLIAFGDIMGLDALGWSQLLGLIGFGVACIGTAVLAGNVTGGNAIATTIAAVLLAVCPPLAFWSRGGMETVLFTATLAFAMAAWVRDDRRGDSRGVSSLTFFLASIMRPEAVGMWAIAVAFDMRPGGRRRSRLLAWWPYVALLGLLLVWKLYYFGDALPNTYHAKSGGGVTALGAGLVYAFRFLQAYGWLGLAIAAVALLVPPSAGRRGAWYVAACATAYVAYVVKLGGDYQGGYRYLVPVLPMLVTLSAAGIAALWDLARPLSPVRRWAAVSIAFGLTFVGLAAPSAREIKARPLRLTRPWVLVDRDVVDKMEFVMMGRSLERVMEPTESVGALAVGAIGYYSERPVLDLFGLNDREIARIPLQLERHDKWRPGHMKGSAAVVLRRRPDYLILSMRPSETRAAPPESDRRKYPFIDDLLSNEEFHELYEMAPIRLPDGRWLNLYRRRTSPPGAVTPESTSVDRGVNWTGTRNAALRITR
jgi:hypothetical protein